MTDLRYSYELQSIRGLSYTRGAGEADLKKILKLAVNYEKRLINRGFYEPATAYQSVHINYRKSRVPDGMHGGVRGRRLAITSYSIYSVSINSRNSSALSGCFELLTTMSHAGTSLDSIYLELRTSIATGIFSSVSSSPKSL